jgi:hypothetical protein
MIIIGTLYNDENFKIINLKENICNLLIVSAGTRFVHTSEGKFLVTRLIPCPRCLSTSSSGGGDNVDPAYNPPPSRPPLAVPSGSDDGWEGGEEGWRVRKSQESYTSDGDSGVGRDSTCSR